ncbi:hypothetical protein A2V68_00325 [candidate division Kazan bacterium RBG_13_50_9]|uniref:EamA domain-containing protein n=1 Tax=candidate division Kazan bacterium RBG_13_50_9 TaxID=1798535 RepID=A0A1F4NSH7_UNCK3|nr:MAG: hypothetical protein A2V68_00325 [candidate division Kazan bacterium RBG_13_50_9]
MIYPFIAVVFDAVALIVEKKFLNTFKNFSYSAFVFWVFASIAVLGLLTSPWLVTISPSAVTPRLLLMMLVLVVLVANYNLLYFFGLKHQAVSEVEPFFLFNPLVAVLIAGAFYADERFWQIYVATVIAGVFLGWSHLRGRQLVLGKPLLAILGFSLMYGLEAVVLRQLLTAYSPVALYLIRVVLTLLFLWIVGRGRWVSLNPKHLPYFIFIALSALITYGLIYYSYTLQGISSTVFVLILSPILVYVMSILVLKEKLKWRNIITSLVLLALVAWVTLAR